MNCKPGDIAISVPPAVSVGRIMEVLYAAPYQSHKLPNGRWNVAATEPSWVVHMLDGPARALLDGFPGCVYEWYGVARDRMIRPIKPPGVEQDLCFDNAKAGES